MEKRKQKLQNLDGCEQIVNHRFLQVHRLMKQPLPFGCYQFTPSPSSIAGEPLGLDKTAQKQQRERIALNRPHTVPTVRASMASPSASNSGTYCSASSLTTGNREQHRTEFNPSDHFAKQSMRSSQMAGKGNTWLRFRKDNQPLSDLLLADHAGVEVEVNFVTLETKVIFRLLEILERNNAPNTAATTTNRVEVQQEPQKA